MKPIKHTFGGAELKQMIDKVHARVPQATLGNVHVYMHGAIAINGCHAIASGDFASMIVFMPGQAPMMGKALFATISDALVKSVGHTLEAYRIDVDLDIQTSNALIRACMDELMQLTQQIMNQLNEEEIEEALEQGAAQDLAANILAQASRKAEGGES